MAVREQSNRLYALELLVRKTVQKYNMLNPGENVLVAVSGGADSVALLHCLHRLAPSMKLSLTIAHLNHRIRGFEGDADEDFVRRMSASLKIPFVSEIIEVKQQAIASRQNLEEVAREKRYDFLRRTASRVGAHKIAVGHTINDQAETILFRFIRGSGIEGLAAIYPVVEDLVIRPLLECTRASILEYLQQKGLRHREDSTNTDIKYARNRIRRELVPYLEKDFNPQLIATLSREAFLAREAWSFIESHARAAFEDLSSRQGSEILLKLPGLAELHPGLQKQVLRLAIKECLGSLRGVTSRLVDSMLSICGTGNSGDQVRMPHGHTAIRQFNTLLLMKNLDSSPPSFIYQLDIPGLCLVAEAGISFRARVCSTPDPKTMRDSRVQQAFLEPSGLPRYLTIRPRKAGDRYGGLGHRKVKKMLIDEKIPQMKRQSLPMVAAGEDVIWIPGFRPARAYEARPGSERCVAIEILQNTGGKKQETKSLEPDS
jgi:tRNA(Ile)-lysidine synthase